MERVARGVMRKKAFTVSSSGSTSGSINRNIDDMALRRIERRKTYFGGQASSSFGLRGDEKQATNAIRGSEEAPLTWTTKHEQRRSIFAVSEGQLKRRSTNRRSTITESRLEPGPRIDERQAMENELEEDEQLPTERQRTAIPTPARQAARYAYGDLETRTETTKQERRRSLLIRNLPVKVSWPDSKTILRARDGIQESNIRSEQKTPPIATYLSMQTEIKSGAEMRAVGQEPIVPQPQCEVSFQHCVAIGAMSDFFRCQYRLGDALAFV